MHLLNKLQTHKDIFLYQKYILLCNPRMTAYYIKSYLSNTYSSITVQEEKIEEEKKRR